MNIHGHAAVPPAAEILCGVSVRRHTVHMRRIHPSCKSLTANGMRGRKSAVLPFPAPLRAAEKNKNTCGKRARKKKYAHSRKCYFSILENFCQPFEQGYFPDLPNI